MNCKNHAVGIIRRSTIAVNIISVRGIPMIAYNIQKPFPASDNGVTRPYPKITRKEWFAGQKQKLHLSVNRVNPCIYSC
jgi:hypothetical protein